VSFHRCSQGRYPSPYPPDSSLGEISSEILLLSLGGVGDRVPPRFLLKLSLLDEHCARRLLKILGSNWFDYSL
jgi:hypothetical protein